MIGNFKYHMKIFIPCRHNSCLLPRSLWEHGHTVVGVEAARPALEEFFEEHSIKYTATDLPDGLGSLLTVSLRMCYKSDTGISFFIGWRTKLLNWILFFSQSEDGRIKLYCCDLFKFNRYRHIYFFTIFCNVTFNIQMLTKY